jgi:hypothetical protein
MKNFEFLACVKGKKGTFFKNRPYMSTKTFSPLFSQKKILIYLHKILLTRSPEKLNLCLPGRKSLSAIDDHPHKPCASRAVDWKNEYISSHCWMRFKLALPEIRFEDRQYKTKRATFHSEISSWHPIDQIADLGKRRNQLQILFECRSLSNSPNVLCFWKKTAELKLQSSKLALFARKFIFLKRWFFFPSGWFPLSPNPLHNSSLF